jgi:hypothetical protein
VGEFLFYHLKGINRTGHNKGFLLFYLHLGEWRPCGHCRVCRERGRALGGDGVTMSNGMGCKGTESQQDLRGCLVDGSGLGRGIDPGRTGGIRGHWDEFTEEAV